MPEREADSTGAPTDSMGSVESTGQVARAGALPAKARGVPRRALCADRLPDARLPALRPGHDLGGKAARGARTAHPRPARPVASGDGHRADRDLLEPEQPASESAPRDRRNAHADQSWSRPAWSVCSSTSPSATRCSRAGRRRARSSAAAWPWPASPGSGGGRTPASTASSTPRRPRRELDEIGRSGRTETATAVLNAPLAWVGTVTWTLGWFVIPLVLTQVLPRLGRRARRPAR